MIDTGKVNPRLFGVGNGRLMLNEPFAGFTVSANEEM
jgi:hypothetical protein